MNILMVYLTMKDTMLGVLLMRVGFDAPYFYDHDDLIGPLPSFCRHASWLWKC